MTVVLKQIFSKKIFLYMLNMGNINCDSLLAHSFTYKYAYSNVNLYSCIEQRNRILDRVN